MWTFEWRFFILAVNARISPEPIEFTQRYYRQLPLGEEALSLVGSC